MRAFSKLVFALVALGSAAACVPNYDHDPCSWDHDKAFPTHDCPMTLMCLHDFNCPDGSVVRDFGSCSGPRCDSDADCASTHFCWAYSDANSYCMPYAECGEEEAGSGWDDATIHGWSPEVTGIY